MVLFTKTYDLLIDNSRELALYHVQLTDEGLKYGLALISQEFETGGQYGFVCPEFKVIVSVPDVFDKYRAGLYWPDDGKCLEVLGHLSYESYKDFLKANVQNKLEKAVTMDREVSGGDY